MSLLWINKTPASDLLSRSEPRESRTINSHVQKTRKDTRLYKSRLRANARQSAARATPPQKTSPDPFDCACIKMDSMEHSILNYYLNVMHHATHTKSEPRVKRLLLRCSQMFKSRAVEVIQDCLTNEAAMYSFLTSIVSHMERFNSVALRHGTTDYMVKSLRVLHKHLDGDRNLNVGIIMSIFHLCCAEMYRHNLQAALIHMSTIKRLVDALGGLQSLEPHLMEIIVLGEVYLATDLLRPSMFPCVYDPGYLPRSPTAPAVQGLGPVTSLTETGRKLLSYTHCDIVTPRLGLIISDLIDLIWVTQDEWSKDSDNSDTAVLRWIFFRNQALRSRLLGLELSDKRGNALRICLLMWILMATTLCGKKRVGKNNAPALKDALADIEDSSWEGHNGLRTWILFIGATSTNDSKSDIHEWFVRELQATSDSESDFEDKQQWLYQSTGGFFYLDALQRPSLETLAQELTDLQCNTDKPSSAVSSHAILLDG